MPTTLDKPLVSIIIAVKNGAQTIRRCLESIVAQTYPRKEVIILDGGSTDGTPDILHVFAATITYWKSEPDRGIYNAWNNGLRQATGDWVCFIGADDWYCKPTALEAIMAVAIAEDAAYVSARCSIVSSEGKEPVVLGLAWCWSRERARMHVCHPGSLYRRSLFDRYGNFSEAYRIAADYEFNLRAIQHEKTSYLDQVVISLGDAGVSHSRIFRAMMETVRIQARHPDIGRPAATVNFLRFMIEYGSYKILKRLGLYRMVRRALIRSGALHR